MIQVPDALAWVVLLMTAGVLVPLLAFGLHRSHLLLLARRPPPHEAEEWKGDVPVVTVQIPVYNEASVIERVVDAAAALDYPADRLQIQILDDSTDATVEKARRRATYWRERGVRVEHVTRDAREGFKAGALQDGLADAEGEFIMILDADFVPHPDLVHRLLVPFESRDVGMVQARWDHLNEHASLLTRCQALLLDAHFYFEQGGRYAGGRFINFNGTAGMWRRSALEDAGGWSADTLTEDLDLSYRCQMKGWRFVYLGGVGVPAEIPEGVSALELQQKRWAQGGVQTGRKLLPTLLRSRWPWAIKLESSVHLLGHLAHPLTLLLGVLLLPSAVARRSLGLEQLLVLDLVVFAGATMSFLVFYTAAGRARGRSLPRVVPAALATLALGIGLTASVSRAVLRGLGSGDRDPFLRTPKRGDRSVSYSTPAGTGDLVMKGLLLLWMLLSLTAAAVWWIPTSIPFLVLFTSGYAWLFLGHLLEFRSVRDEAGEAGQGDAARSVGAGARPWEIGNGLHAGGGVVALIPALDEEAALPGVLAELEASGVMRVVVVDNGSADRTAEVAAAAGAWVVSEPRRGYGAACLAGLDEIRGWTPQPDVVVFLDGDGSDDPGAMERLLRPLRDGTADMVVGVRTPPKGARVRIPLHARMGNALVRGGARLLHGARMRDFGPFRAIRAPTLEALGMDDRNWGWTLQMQLRAHHAGVRTLEVPVPHRARSAGRSKVSGSMVGSVKAGAKMLLTLMTEIPVGRRLRRRRG